MSSDPEVDARQAAEAVQVITRPWSKKRLGKLGKAIRDSQESPEDQSTYQDVMIWYNELAVAVQRAAKLYLATQQEFAGIEPTSRAKTKGTLREKLDRDHHFQLPAIQDIAGIRIEGPFSLSQQDRLAEGLTSFFGQPHECINDLRENPRQGYRAVHLQLEFAGRVEIQIRTKLQSEWANAYEKLADILGRGIRYGQLPDNPRDKEYVLDLQTESSESIAAAERSVELMNRLKETQVESSDVLAGLRNPELERKPVYRAVINEAKFELRKIDSKLRRVEKKHAQTMQELAEHYAGLNRTFQEVINRHEQDLY